MHCELTDARLRALPLPEKGRIELWDTRQRNLVLRISAGGSYAWSVPARTQDGGRTRVALGNWPEVGIAEARKRARTVIGEIAGGGDPMAERRAARSLREQRASTPKVAARMAEWQAAKERDWSERHAREVARIIAKDIVPALGKQALTDTTRADWARIVAAKRKTAPAMASALYRVSSAFLGFAEANGWIAAALLPRKGLQTLAPAAKPRDRVLSGEELTAVWHASANIGPRPRAFVRLLILTAAREMEVADISVGEVDRDGARWAIPPDRAKNEQPLTLPLGPLALAELAAVWPSVTVSAGWKLLRIRGFSKLKAKIDRLSGVEGWVWHDLRRTARTGMTRLGVPRDHAEAAVNHISGRTALERTYDRHDYAAEVIAASLRWQSHVENLMSERPSAEVISLARNA